MEFLPGGDLMSLLMKEDIFSEVATRQASVFCSLCRLDIREIYNSRRKRGTFSYWQT